MDLTHKDVDSILKIIDEGQHLNEIEFVVGGLRLRVVRSDAGIHVLPRVDRVLPMEERAAE
jgi:hypothetical protein